MAKPRPKFYVVWTGRTPGIYDTWSEASAQIEGFSGAKYKSFGTREEAEGAFQGDDTSHLGKRPEPVRRGAQGWISLGVDPTAVAVDAACSGVPGPVEYRGIDIATGQLLFQVGPLEDGTNNVGEFLALVHAAALLAREGRHETVIYSDSMTALSWIKNRAPRSKLQRSERNSRLFELMDRATVWLRTNTVRNPIRKWDTDRWGEIPADYGRK